MVAMPRGRQALSTVDVAEGTEMWKGRKKERRTEKDRNANGCGRGECKISAVTLLSFPSLSEIDIVHNSTHARDHR